MGVSPFGCLLRDDELTVIEDVVRGELKPLLLGEKAQSTLKKGKKILITKGAKFDEETLDLVPLAQLEGLVLKDPKLTERVHELLERYRDQGELTRMVFEQQVSRYEKGDDLPPGVIKLVKIYVAMKRKLSVGDKMAGRHGNKGVISTIVPVEDMPYLEDGSPVDIVLNPLGVPSRMNVGQVLETHLGWAAKGLGREIDAMLKAQESVAKIRQFLEQLYNKTGGRVEDIKSLSDEEVIELAGNLTNGVPTATPVFDGATEAEIKGLLELAELGDTGQSQLFDGRTGEEFDRMLKVVDKVCPTNPESWRRLLRGLWESGLRSGDRRGPSFREGARLGAAWTCASGRSKC